MGTSEMLLLVGNGLSMDLRQQFPEHLAEWHTGRPLSWELVHPELNRPLKELFPAAYDALVGYAGTDFERMTKLLEDEDSESKCPVVELRHYLVMAFSMYQRAVDQLPLSQWQWWQFIRGNRDRISGIVSFNYDLVVERLAARAGIRLFTEGVPDDCPALFDELRPHKALLWKPHGSLDYRPTKNSIVMPSTYPLMNWAFDNDLPLERFPSPEWTVPRIEADVVVPTESSRYRHFQWVVPGEQVVRAQGRRWGVCVIVGISYAPCDREEIDIVLTSLPQGAQVVVVDPSPSADLLQRLGDLRLEVTCMQRPPALGAA